MPLTTMAQAPSLSRLQSSSRSGSEIMREAWWSSMEIGFVMIALPLRMALARVDTAISPNWRLVVP